jgi:hypothetical protein
MNIDITFGLAKLKEKYNDDNRKRDENVVKVYIDEQGDYWARVDGRIYLMGDSGALLSPRAEPEVKMKYLFKVEQSVGKFGEIIWDVVIEKIRIHRRRRNENARQNCED